MGIGKILFEFWIEQFPIVIFFPKFHPRYKSIEAQPFMISNLNHSHAILKVLL